MGLILLRHTTPDVTSGTCYGQTDLGVASSFPEEAETAFSKLPPFESIISSPLTRCRKLAEFIASKTQLSIQIDRRLIEMDFGSWEGRAWSDIHRAEIDEWADDVLHARPHGGESVAMLRDRTLEALKDILKRKIPTLVVTHSGVIKAALAKSDQAETFNTQIDFGGHVTISDLQGDQDE